MIKSIFNTWMRLSVCLAALLIYSASLRAQPNFWTIFGLSGAGCSTNAKMPCTLTPSSTPFSSAPVLHDLSTITTFTDYFKNSVYDGSGNLLFSVNGNGIYAPDGTGTQVYAFSGPTISYTCSSGSLYYTPTNAISEIVTVPVPGNPNSYYVIFWCDAFSGSPDVLLRAIEVTINTANYGTSAPVSTWYSIVQDVALNAPNLAACTSNYFTDYTSSGYGGAFEIVADAPNSDCSRDIYTVNTDQPSPGSYSTSVRKWHISNSGTLPTTIPSPLNTAGTLLPAFATKAKLFKVLRPLTTSTYDKVFAYVGFSNGIYHSGNYLQTYNLVTGNYATYKAPYFSGGVNGDQAIWGFEYLPSTPSTSLNVFCFAFIDASTSNGGLGYAAPVTGTTTITSISSTSNFAYSDLELDNHGDMYMVNQDPTTGLGSLYYIVNSSLTNHFTSSAPSQCITTCPSSTPISVNNFQTKFTNPGSGVSSWYLGTQIRGENYMSWGTLPYVVTDAETWTSSSNPTGHTSSVISMGNIVIKPGASLTISGITIQEAPGSFIDVYNAPVASTTLGGRLVLSNATLTSSTTACGTSAPYLWGGVRVWGDVAQRQITIPTSHQGALIMTNSTISYAHVGVFVGEYGVVGGAGGGIIKATNSLFLNNNTGVSFLPYNNFNPLGAPLPNLSTFSYCTFNSADAGSIVSGLLVHIACNSVKGITIAACDFENHTGNISNSYGILGYNAGFSVIGAGLTTITPSTFTGFYAGIYHIGISASYTPYISNSVFTNNFFGINLSGSIAPSVIANKFYVPHSMATSTFPYYTQVKAIGVQLYGADLYSVYGNSFTESSTPILPYTINQTVGVLAFNTELGTEDNLINNNNYTGLGTANLADNKNNHYSTSYANNGLWYKCNNNSSNINDIAAMATGTPIGGIRYNQGYPVGDPSYLLTGFPAGNTFTGSPYSIVYNIYDDVPYCTPIIYFYGAGSSPSEYPGVPLVTANDYPFGLPRAPTVAGDNCVLPSPFTISPTTLAFPTPIPLSLANNPVDAYLITLNNINYYMSDTNGIPHRDSVYYWVHQLNSTSGRLANAYLLLEDGYADSARNLYDSIPVHDSLDSVEYAEFTGPGSKLFDVQSKILTYYANIHNAVLNAYADSLNPDSVLLHDTALYADPPLDTASTDTLIAIFHNSNYWAHIRAENILFTYNPSEYISLLTANPDTLLYPPSPDTTLPTKANPGVLTVTELSRGPSGHTGCEYAELIVANCGSDASTDVDISGWIIDDNSGNFDTAGCSATGITKGHYRLDPNGVGWQNIPVGSVLVIYNASTNCYHLPDTFTIDTAHLVFWIPIYDTAAPFPTGFGVQRYAGVENTDSTHYCSDTGTTVYTSAYGWEQTIALTEQDAIQVRCPGCTTAFPGTPPFYHGAGYAPNTTYCFVSIPSAASSLGGPVIYNSGGYLKYVFTGSTVSDLGNATKWSAVTPDTAGTPPPTVGNVDSAYYAAVTGRTLGLPCCNYVDTGARNAQAHHAVQVNNANTNIKVYPNPATQTVYFVFPASDRVTVKLMDITGRVMNEQVVPNATGTSFDVSSYSPGIYLYQVVTKGKTQSGKIVIGN